MKNIQSAHLNALQSQLKAQQADVRRPGLWIPFHFGGAAPWYQLHLWWDSCATFLPVPLFFYYSPFSACSSSFSLAESVKLPIALGQNGDLVLPSPFLTPQLRPCVSLVCHYF